jgi:hypothetical protein
MIALGSARRRADTPRPHTGVLVGDLTEAQATDVQIAIGERYLGELEREEWAAICWRTATGCGVRRRVLDEIKEIREPAPHLGSGDGLRARKGAARTGNQRGSPDYWRARQCGR